MLSYSAQQVAASGIGGGGHATVGGKGGDVASYLVGGFGGPATGSETLIPLRGGCPGFQFGARGRGGGAVQLSSMMRILVIGWIDVRGEPGRADTHSTGGYDIRFMGGGGAGGGILLEAPIVELASSARLLANGAPGASYYSTGMPSATEEPDQGTPSTEPNHGSGGHGAAPGVPAQAGQDVPSSADAAITGGGGGGGLGYLRINTSDGTYIEAPTTIRAAAVSGGSVTRR